MSENGRVERTPSGKLVTHGSPSSYNNHKCRCVECRAAWAAYMKPRIAKRRAEEKQRKTQEKVQVKL